MRFCDICFEEKELFGVRCKTCKNRCCIECEIKLQKCPFCRKKSLNWSEKVKIINEKQLDFYLNEFISLDKKKIERQQYLEKLFHDGWNGCNKSLREIITGNLSDDDIVDILECVKVFIYDIIYNSKNINDEIENIKELLLFVQLIYDRIQTENNFFIDIDELEELIGDILEKKNKCKSPKKYNKKNFYKRPKWSRGALKYTRY